MSEFRILSLQLSGEIELPVEVVDLIDELKTVHGIDFLKYTAWCILNQSKRVLESRQQARQSEKEVANSVTSNSVVNASENNSAGIDPAQMSAMYNMLLEIKSKVDSVGLQAIPAIMPVGNFAKTAVIEETAASMAVDDTPTAPREVIAPKAGGKFDLAAIKAKNKAMSGN